MKKLQLVLSVLLLTTTLSAQNADKHIIANFIKNNPGKSAVYIVQNGEVIADINSDRKSPLASTVKIIVAIEYAAQAAAGRIDPQMMVDTAELNKYYIPNTDGGAQPGFMQLMKKQNDIKDGKVPLEEVAKGMVKFSSNANTEYLLDLLGLENVNARLDKLGIKTHDKLYYFIAALGVINGRTAEELGQISMGEYIEQCKEVHALLKADPEYRKTITNLPLDVQKVWSDRLPGSTPQEYAGIMQKINSRTYFDKETQQHLVNVLEGIMENPANKKILKHAGMKGGSTAWVLTKAVYATTVDDDSFEIVYFFNNLTLTENMELQQNINKFELGILTNKDEARTEILQILNN